MKTQSTYKVLATAFSTVLIIFYLGWTCCNLPEQMKNCGENNKLVFIIFIHLIFVSLIVFCLLITYKIYKLQFTEQIKKNELKRKKKWEEFLLENYEKKENLNKEKEQQKSDIELKNLEFEQSIALMKEYKNKDDLSIEKEINDLKEKVKKLEEQKAIFVEISKKKD